MKFQFGRPAPLTNFTIQLSSLRLSLNRLYLAYLHLVFLADTSTLLLYIMTLLGEPPIWSYFKPKTASNPHPSKRRRHEHAGADSAKDSEPEVNGSVKKGKGKTTTVGKVLNHPKNDTLSPSDPRTPKTPNVSSGGKRTGHALQGFLPTPPTTNAGPSRRYTGTSPHTKRSSSRNATPVSKGLCHTTAVYDDGATSKSSTDDQSNSTFDHELEDTDLVHSSQTQDDLVCPPSNHSIQSNALNAGKTSPGPDLHLSSSVKTREFVDDTDDILIVQSSQSQLPLSIPDCPYKHPRPANIITNLHNYDSKSSITECIPSSQSQEIELSIPLEAQGNDESRFDLKQSSSRCVLSSGNAFFVADNNFSLFIRPNTGSLHRTTNPHLKRTLSDFPVPIYEPFVTDIFREQDQHDPQPNPILPKAHGEQDADSVTESESEDCDSRLDDFRQQSSKLPDTPPPQEASYDASQEDTTEGIGEDSQSYSDDPPILEPGPESPEYSFGSLPPELKEIFGNRDDSFPPDFPMSLR